MHLPSVSRWPAVTFGGLLPAQKRIIEGKIQAKLREKGITAAQYVQVSSMRERYYVSIPVFPAQESAIPQITESLKELPEVTEDAKGALSYQGYPISIFVPYA